MSERHLSFYLIDVFIAIDKIKRYTQPFNDAQSLLYNDIHWDATIRELEIIGEATNKILHLTGDASKEKRRIVNFRNQIVHGYFGINENIVWDVIQSKLNDLHDDLFKLIDEQKIDLTEALESAETENSYNKEVLSTLAHIRKNTSC